MLRRLHLSDCFYGFTLVTPVHTGSYSGTFTTCNAEEGCAYEDLIMKWHSISIMQVLCNLRYDHQVTKWLLRWLKLTYRIASASNEGVFHLHIMSWMYNFRQGGVWRHLACRGTSEDPVVCTVESPYYSKSVK